MHGSEQRRMSSNDQEKPNALRSRSPFCSFSAFCLFYTRQDDAAPISDGSLWRVRALFRVVGTDGPVSQPATKWWASPAEPAEGRSDALWLPTAATRGVPAGVPDTTE